MSRQTLLTLLGLGFLFILLGYAMKPHEPTPHVIDHGHEHPHTELELPPHIETRDLLASSQPAPRSFGLDLPAPEDTPETPELEQAPSIFDNHQPTEANFAKWLETMDRESTPELWAELCDEFAILQEYQALRTFCVNYQTRETERWANHEPSIPLENELGENVSLLSDDAYAAVVLYQEDVLEKIWSAGFEGDSTDDPQSRWQLGRFIAAQPKYHEAFQSIESVLDEL